MSLIFCLLIQGSMFRPCWVRMKTISGDPVGTILCIIKERYGGTEG